MIPQYAPKNMFGHKWMLGSWLVSKFFSGLQIPLFSRRNNKGGVDLRKQDVYDAIREVYPKWSMDKWQHPHKKDDMMGPYYSKEFLKSEMEKAGNHDKINM